MYAAGFVPLKVIVAIVILSVPIGGLVFAVIMRAKASRITVAQDQVRFFHDTDIYSVDISGTSW